MKTHNTKILFIHPGPGRPSHIREHNQFFCLSAKYSGYVISTTWGNKSRAEVNNYIKNTARACGAFSYLATANSSAPGIIRTIWSFLFFIISGAKILYISKQTKLIVSYGLFSTGLAGVILKLLFRRKLLVEVPGVPGKSFLYTDDQGISNFIKKALAEVIYKIVLRFADGVKLLFPGQLGEIKLRKNTRVFIFHEFVPVTSLNRIFNPKKSPYILFIGHPWYLKGVDILINAFNNISHKFPEYKLKILGYCKNPTFYKRLCSENNQIEFLQASPHEHTMEVLSSATLLILPSRTEAMGRVILEAMSIGIPVIASNVDGIPYYIEDKKSGLLFQSEDQKSLEDALVTLLNNQEKQLSLASYAKRVVIEKYSEEKYFENYVKMVEDLIKENS